MYYPICYNQIVIELLSERKMFEINGLKHTNLYEIIADKIEEIIVNDPSMVGERLPSEQSVADEFGVSRNVVREAFKVLKERGLVDVRCGDGAYASKPQPEMVTAVLDRLVLTDSTKVTEIFEVRHALEVMAARLAARRADEVQLDVMTGCIEDMKNHRDDRVIWSDSDLNYHIALVDATGNTIFRALFASVSKTIRHLFELAWGNETAMNEGIADHTDILAAIRERNEEEAARLMELHLAHSEKNLAIIAEINGGLQ
jgi:Transcriptional regulators